jgi:hypothetical protein
VQSDIFDALTLAAEGGKSDKAEPFKADTSTGVPTQEQWVCGANSANFSTKQIAQAAWGPT